MEMRVEGHGLVRTVMIGCAVLMVHPVMSLAQLYGVQERADAATDAINLAVTQAISQLPPASGQTFTYRYDPALGTFAADTQLGPTAFRSTQTIGAGKFSLRVAASYFDLSDSAGPIEYEVEDNRLPVGYGVTGLGMSTSTKVTTLSFGSSYGITDRVEVILNIPVTVVRAQASQVYTTTKAEVMAGMRRPVVTPCLPEDPDFKACRARYRANFKRENNPYIDHAIPFNEAGASFNDGTHVGLSRISLGIKGALWSNDWLGIGAQGDFYMPSPSSDEFAGSDTGSFLPRLLLEARAAKHLNFYTDLGYDCDYSTSELRRFVWNAGLSVPLVNVTFDAGVGGSQYEDGIEWTPRMTSGVGDVTLTAFPDESTDLGTTYVDFLYGMKVQLWGQSAISGAVAVPLTSDGLRPDAIGTVALEYYF